MLPSSSRWRQISVVRPGWGWGGLPAISSIVVARRGVAFRVTATVPSSVRAVVKWVTSGTPLGPSGRGCALSAVSAVVVAGSGVALRVAEAVTGSCWAVVERVSGCAAPRWWPRSRRDPTVTAVVVASYGVALRVATTVACSPGTMIERVSRSTSPRRWSCRHSAVASVKVARPRVALRIAPPISGPAGTMIDRISWGATLRRRRRNRWWRAPSLIVAVVPNACVRYESRFLGRGVAPLLDDRLLNPPRVLPAAHAHFLGHVDAVFCRFETRHQLRHVLAEALWLQVAHLLRYFLNKLRT